MHAFWSSSYKSKHAPDLWYGPTLQRNMKRWHQRCDGKPHQLLSITVTMEISKGGVTAENSTLKKHFLQVLKMFNYYFASKLKYVHYDILKFFPYHDSPFLLLPTLLFILVQVVNTQGTESPNLEAVNPESISKHKNKNIHVIENKGAFTLAVQTETEHSLHEKWVM